MTVTSLASLSLSPIDRFASRGAAAVPIATGEGETRTTFLRFEPGGEIGRHPAGFGQLFVLLSGTGWVSGGDGVRIAIRAGEVAAFDRGETHAKGSETGMTALMIQVSDVALDPAAFRSRSG
jgi:quercetin dioxygenase-like cupin family protein